MDCAEKLAELAVKYGQFLGEPVSLLGGKAMYKLLDYVITVDFVGVYPRSRIVSVRKGDDIIYISPFVKIGAFMLDFEVYDRIKYIPSDEDTLCRILNEIRKLVAGAGDDD